MNEVELPVLTPGKIAVTVGELLGSANALSNLAGMALRGSYALRLARLMKAAQTELDTYNEARVALVKRLGEPTENGEDYRVTPENEATFFEQIKEMHAEAVTLPGTLLNGDALGESPIAVADLMALDWLFE